MLVSSEGDEMTADTTNPMTVRSAMMSIKDLMPLSKQPRPSATSAEDVDGAANAFLAEAKKSPMERVKEAILKKHGMTEAQFEQLPAEKQTQIQREIEETMTRKMKGAGAAPATGMNANVLA